MSSSTVCVDASFVVRLFMGPDDSRFWDILGGWYDQGVNIYAPGLMSYEVANAFYRYHRAGYLSQASAELAVDAALGLPIRLESDGALHRAAVRIAEAAGWPAIYDAHYLALAERLNAELWTTDARLARDVGKQGPAVRLIESEAY